MMTFFAVTLIHLLGLRQDDLVQEDSPYSPTIRLLRLTGDSDLIGVSEQDEQFSIWTHEIDTDRFRSHVSGLGYEGLLLIPGSTAAAPAWGYSEIRRSGCDSALKLPDGTVEDEGYFLDRTQYEFPVAIIGQGKKLLVARWKSQRFHLFGWDVSSKNWHEYVLWDVCDWNESANLSIPSSRTPRGTPASIVDLGGKYFFVWETELPPNSELEFVSLYRIEPFTKLFEESIPGKALYIGPSANEHAALLAAVDSDRVSFYGLEVNERKSININVGGSLSPYPADLEILMLSDDLVFWTVSADPRVYVKKWDEDRIVRVAPTRMNSSGRFSVSKDGRKLVTWGDRNTYSLWDIDFPEITLRHRYALSVATNDGKMYVKRVEN